MESETRILTVAGLRSGFLEVIVYPFWATPKAESSRHENAESDSSRILCRLDQLHGMSPRPVHWESKRGRSTNLDMENAGDEARFESGWSVTDEPELT